jgi:hypothetical protein
MLKKIIKNEYGGDHRNLSLWRIKVAKSLEVGMLGGND